MSPQIDIGETEDERRRRLLREQAAAKLFNKEPLEGMKNKLLTPNTPSNIPDVLSSTATAPSTPIDAAAVPRREPDVFITRDGVKVGDTKITHEDWRELNLLKRARAVQTSNPAIAGLLEDWNKANFNARMTEQVKRNKDVKDWNEARAGTVKPELTQIETKGAGDLSDIKSRFQEQVSSGEIAGAGLNLLETGIEAATKPKMVRDALVTGAKLIESITDVLPADFRLGTAKSTGVIKAEQAFTDAAAVIEDDIDAVAKGSKDFDKVNKDIDAALETIHQLELETVGLGKVNLRYWLDEGLEIETQIKREISNLEAKRVRLLQAAAQAQANQMVYPQ